MVFVSSLPFIRKTYRVRLQYYPSKESKSVSAFPPHCWSAGIWVFKCYLRYIDTGFELKHRCWLWRKYRACDFDHQDSQGTSWRFGLSGSATSPVPDPIWAGGNSLEFVLEQRTRLSFRLPELCEEFGNYYPSFGPEQKHRYFQGKLSRLQGSSRNHLHKQRIPGALREGVKKDEEDTLS